MHLRETLLKAVNLGMRSVTRSVDGYEQSSKRLLDFVDDKIVGKVRGKWVLRRVPNFSAPIVWGLYDPTNKEPGLCYITRVTRCG